MDFACFHSHIVCSFVVVVVVVLLLWIWFSVCSTIIFFFSLVCFLSICPWFTFLYTLLYTVVVYILLLLLRKQNKTKQKEKRTSKIKFKKKKKKKQGQRKKLKKIGEKKTTTYSLPSLRERSETTGALDRRALGITGGEPVAQLPTFGFGPHYRLPAF